MAQIFFKKFLNAFVARVFENRRITLLRKFLRMHETYEVVRGVVGKVIASTFVGIIVGDENLTISAYFNRFMNIRKAAETSKKCFPNCWYPTHFYEPIPIIYP